LKKSLTGIAYILILFAVSFVFNSCISSDKSDINTDDPEEALRIAKSNYNKEKYLQAIDDFSYIKLRFTGTKIIDEAQYYFGMCYFKRKEYILSAYEFDYLIKNYPTSEFMPKARYQLAMCYYHLSPGYGLDQTYTYYAISEFITFLELYPNDINSPDAEKKILELRNKLAFKDFKSGILYYNMDDYKAAIVYFDNILENYFDSDYADDALYWKIESLMKRKKYEEAKNEIERFEKKFPSSEFLKNVKDIKNSIPSTSG
jgi:outer membrane protein assembly factor BamD